MRPDEDDEYMSERTADLEPLAPTEDEKEAKQLKKLNDKDRAEMLEDGYRSILSTRPGRMALHDQLDKMGYWLVPYDPTSQHHTAYLNGARAAAVDLYELLWKLSPDDVLTMVKENRT